MKPNLPEPRFLSVPDAGKICGVSRNTVYMWVKNGKLKAYQTPGRTNLIRPCDLQDFMTNAGMFVPGSLTEMVREDEILQREPIVSHTASGPKVQASILVVDDDAMILTLVNQALKGQYTVHMASTGYEALHLLTRHPEIQLVLLDLRMPGQHGLDTLSEIHRLNPGARVVVVTGFSEELPPASPGQGLYSRVVAKPVETGVLREIVAEELSRSR